MKLYLARHGRTNYNDLVLCNYDPSVDVHLTSVGVEQAKTLADAFKNIPVDHIFVSELKRTQQTADLINTFHNLKLNVDTRLNDIVSGFEGKPFAEYWAALTATPDMWAAHLNGGESIEDVKKRVADFMHELQTKKYDAILIVTSQWIINAIVAYLKDISNEEAWNQEAEQGSYLEFDIH